MDKKSKVLFIVFSVLIAISVGVTYWRIMIKKDYIIEASIDCDPYEEACFVWECDPESDVEGEACTGDPEEDVWYFKVARRNAANIPLCAPNEDEECMPFVCEEGEDECEEELCTEEVMEDYYASACNDPMTFTEENPIIEEAEVEADGEFFEEEIVEEVTEESEDAKSDI